MYDTVNEPKNGLLRELWEGFLCIAIWIGLGLAAGLLLLGWSVLVNGY